MGSSVGSAMAKRRGAGLDCIELGVELIGPDAGALVEGATISLRISSHDGGRLANSFCSFSDIAGTSTHWPRSICCVWRRARVSSTWPALRPFAFVGAERIFPPISAVDAPLPVTTTKLCTPW
jgi:hypothetical protein